MIQAVWQFVVKKEAVERFEQAYGPDGAWARLFARHTGFRGTTLLRDAAGARTYLTIDVWESAADRERMMKDAAAEYARLDAAFGDWTESEIQVGIFEVV